MKGAYSVHREGLLAENRHPCSFPVHGEGALPEEREGTRLGWQATKGEGGTRTGENTVIPLHLSLGVRLTPQQPVCPTNPTQLKQKLLQACCLLTDARRKDLGHTRESVRVPWHSWRGNGTCALQPQSRRPSVNKHVKYCLPLRPTSYVN